MPAKRIIQVQKAPETARKHTPALELLAQLCYHYPQYRLDQARRLPYKRVVILLRVAQQEKAKEYHNLVHIAFAPHTDKAQNVEMLLNHYEDKIGGE